MSSPNNTPARSKVRAKLLHGKPVRFDAEKQTEKQREVPAQWVAEALRAGRRVELVNAILTGPLDLQSAHVEQEFILLGGEVRGPVNAFYARFARWVMFHDVDFHDEVSFKGARFAAELNCAGTHFLKSVTFEDSIMEGSFTSRGAQFGSSERDPVGFNGCEIRCAAHFVSAVFHGPAQFMDLTVGKQANFNGARFEHGAAFDRAEIGGGFFFRPEGEQRAQFVGAARFHGVKVGGQADFSGARFEHGAAFDRAEIGGGFFFRPEGEQRVEFVGAARFSGVKVGGQANFSGAQFKQEVSFQGATVEGETVFVGVEFQKAVSFQRAEFKAGLYFSQAQSSPATFGGGAKFLGIKVGGQAAFNGARFEQEVGFDGAEIGGSLYFLPQGKQRVKFGGEARFHGVKVGGQADFREAQFEQPAFFEGAVFVGGSFFREVEFSTPASFVNVRFQLAAEFQGAQFQGPADFDYARFEQEAHFAGAKFGGQLRLRDARMTTLSFQEAGKTAYFDEKFKVDLLGCTYDRLEIDGWHKLMDRQSGFNPRPWSHLEKVLRAAGHKAEADDVYYDRRKREGRQILLWNRPDRWLFDFMEQIFAGYGVRNWRVLAWIAFFLAFSTYIFNMPGAVVRKQTDTKPAAESVSTVSPVPKNPAAAETPPVQLWWGDALAFSLKTFLPVEIPVARDWEPRPGWYSAWAAVLNLLGWIFIPVALATVTGWMRRAHPD